MKKWMRRLENIMAASAFAEAGEFEAARETIREQRKILLALRGDQSDTNAFRYAVNTCKRLGAELEILSVSKIDKSFISQLRSELMKEGIEYLLIQKSGPLEKEIKHYTGMKSDILFVVVEVSDGVDIHSRKSEKIITDAWKNLKCPLVVVSRTESPAAA